MMMSSILFIMPEPSDPFALYRISVQITNSQYELLNKHKKPGTSISELIRRSIDTYFAPVMKNELIEHQEKITV
tara:strand:+ start:292 stop:513 length:222 start_codon:yes stop_codon:yes gene_type:complete